MNQKPKNKRIPNNRYNHHFSTWKILLHFFVLVKLNGAIVLTIVFILRWCRKSTSLPKTLVKQIISILSLLKMKNDGYQFLRQKGHYFDLFHRKWDNNYSCHILLNPKLKRVIQNRRRRNRSFHFQIGNFYSEVLKKLLQLYEKCLQLNGDYVEKQK